MTPDSETINNLPESVYERLCRAIEGSLDTVFPAITLSVLCQGERLLEAAWGWVDPETRQNEVTVSTLFDLASVSKLFTATAFLSLVSDGKVKLDEPLVKMIPEFGVSGPRPMDGGQDPHTRAMLPIAEEVRGQYVDPELVTFWHLLTHTSGLAPWRAIFKAAEPIPLRPDERDPVPIEQRQNNALAAICNSSFVGQPGERVCYSDLGLILMGEAVARLHGSPLDSAIRERVFEPMRLESPVYNPMQQGQQRHEIVPTEFDAMWRGRRCWGEVHDENACGMGGIAGHAGLFARVGDVAALGQAWLDEDRRLNIDPELMAMARTEQAVSDGERRGLGWMLTAKEDSSAGSRFSQASYGHMGFTGTSLWIDPERRLVVACLTNRVYYGRERVGIHAFRQAIHDIVAEGVGERS